MDKCSCICGALGRRWSCGHWSIDSIAKWGIFLSSLPSSLFLHLPVPGWRAFGEENNFLPCFATEEADDPPFQVFLHPGMPERRLQEIQLVCGDLQDWQCTDWHEFLRQPMQVIVCCSIAKGLGWLRHPCARSHSSDREDKHDPSSPTLHVVTMSARWSGCARVVSPSQDQGSSTMHPFRRQLQSMQSQGSPSLCMSWNRTSCGCISQSVCRCSHSLNSL